MSTASIASQLVKALKHIDRPGTFCTSGSATPALPGLEVTGVGMIGLPMSESQAKELKRQCEQAPYGKGTDTLVDTSVRRVWRLTPDRFSLINPAWSDFLSKCVSRIQTKLGLEGQTLEAHLYDLLLYEAGGFFLPHKDGEKLDRMVATLVVVLPSQFEGGELVVRHEGQEQIVDFAGPDSQFKIKYAAFYADCEHEVKPLKSGHRLCLIYNLVLAKSKSAIGAPRLSDNVATIAEILRQWKETPDSPTKLALTLEHEYTRDGLEWDTLKGVDRAKARALADAAAQAGFRAYLALLTYWESGSAEGDYDYGRRGYGRSRYGDDSEGSHEMGEVFDTTLTAENWRSATGEKLPFGEIPVEREEVIPGESLTEIDPEEDFEGYTGNAGMTLERWYRHAAICLWPDEKHLDVLCQVGSKKSLPALERMVKEWQSAEGEKSTALKARCIEFAGKILANWPTSEFRGYGSWKEDSAAPDPMASLDLFDDPNLIRIYLGRTLVQDATLEPGKATAQVLARHGWGTFRPELVQLFGATNNNVMERNARLLEKICVKANSTSTKKKDLPEAEETCRLAAGVVMAALQKIDTSKDSDDWRSTRIDRSPLLISIMKSLLAAHLEDLLQDLILLIYSLPERYSLRETQLPTLTALAPWFADNVSPFPAPLSRWITSCRQQLESLTAEMPRPPGDFRRDDGVTCKCKDCAELKRFLVDPVRKDATFKMVMARRSHLESAIQSARADLDRKTVTRSSPHELVCTKNVATYERNLKQYHEDLKSLRFVRSLL